MAGYRNHGNAYEGGEINGRKAGLESDFGTRLWRGVVHGQELPIEFIRVVDVSGLLNEGAQVVFVEVRSRQEYLIQHIKGAISIPLSTLEAHYGEIPQEGLVVLY